MNSIPELVIIQANEDHQQELCDLLLQNGQKPTILVNDKSIYFFAKINREKVGLIGAEMSGEYALVRSLAVLEPWRKRGLAIKLTDILFAELKSKNIKYLYLFSRDTGSFWQKAGFIKCDVREIIKYLGDAPQVIGYLKDQSIWTDVGWQRPL